MNIPRTIAFTLPEISPRRRMTWPRRIREVAIILLRAVPKRAARIPPTVEMLVIYD